MLKTRLKSFSLLFLTLILLGFSVTDSPACRMYGVISDNLPDGMLGSHLVTDPHSLSVLSNIHTDGWGIAHYQDYGDTPVIERGVIRALNDPAYSTAVDGINVIEPNITLAHIRLCSSGCCDHGGDSIADPHPFYRTKNGKTWTFIHNGGVDYNRLYALVGDAYLNANGPYGSEVTGCSTPDPYDPLVIDSELYFLHILKNIEENGWNVENGIVEAVRELINDGETGGMIFILSDGNTLWAFLRGSIPSYHTLYYDYNAAEGYSAVASEYPSDPQGNWQPIHNNELVVFTAQGPPVIIDVTSYDGVPDGLDNCPLAPNGPLLGTCTAGTIGVTCMGDGDCGTAGFCSMNQEDTYPLQGNGIGDACECEGNFDCDQDCDGSDAATFKIDFGRSTYNNPCESVDSCNGDFDCDGDCDGTDAALFKQDFGRSQFNNSCPLCTPAPWCVYPSEIHENVLTVDTHVDTPLFIYYLDLDLGEYHDPHEINRKVDFPRMEQGGLDAIFFAFWVAQGPRTPEGNEDALQLFLNIYSATETQLQLYTDRAGIALSPGDAYSLETEGKRAIFFGMENGYPLGTDLSLVSTYYDLGIRYITLCHSENNDICDSSTDPAGPEHNGLSDFGVQVIQEMNRLGMMVDVSHVSDETFYDVLALTTAPVIASHSNARAVYDHPRNLSDAMITALAVNRGVIQVPLLYVKADDPGNPPAVSDVVDHIDHIVQVAGIDHVGIGTDFDGGGEVEDCYDLSEMGNITVELVRRGYSEEQVGKIWGGNLMRVFTEVEQAAE